MISKQELLDSISHETNIIKHLASKLTEDNLDYRPSEIQRSTLELLQYLTECAITPATNAVTGNWDHAEEFNKEAQAVTLESFPSAMDRQIDRIGNLLDGITDEDLAAKDATLPWGAPLKAGAALMNMPLKCLTAYRMNLFLYMRGMGIEGISTANNWAGVDMPKAAEG